MVDAEKRLHDEGIAGDIYLFKNNTDSAGNSYGCHENYLVGRHGEFSRLADVLIPFLVTRQLICGAGKVLQTPRGAVYCVSQRAEHIWEGVSSATTRSPADHQHPRRTARRRRALPAPARHRRRLEHERVDDPAEGRHRSDLVLRMIEARHHLPRPDPGEPDPRHPRDQPRPGRHARRSAGRRTIGVRTGDPARIPRPCGGLRRARRRRRHGEAGVGTVGTHAGRGRDPGPHA